MRRIVPLLLVAVLLLCGCSELIPPRSTVEFSETPNAQAEAVQPQLTSIATIPADELPMRQCYQAVLECLYTDHTWPDGQTAELQGFIEENRFAIADVDGDGAQELVIFFTSTYMAGKCAAVYGYDAQTQQVFQELTASLATTLYDNGLAKLDDSHNHSWSMEVWPWSLARYDAAADRYVETTSVQGWEKEFGDVFWEDNQPFPDDKAEDGLVYRIAENGAVLLLSPTEYARWEQELFGNAQPVPLDCLPLTPETIQSVTTGTIEDWRTEPGIPMLWEGDEILVQPRIEAERVVLYADEPLRRLLAWADYPRPLPLDGMTDYTVSTTDLDEDGTGDLDVTIHFADGSQASLLWLWDSWCYVSNSELTFYPGESGK